MIVCASCGTHNQDGESFCGDCGAYLEWEGQRFGPSAPAGTPPAPAATAPPAPAATAPPAPAAAAPPAAPISAPSAGAHAAPSWAPPPLPPQGGPPQGAPPPVPPPTASASALVVPLGAAPADIPAPDRSESPGAVLPGQAAPRARRVEPAPQDRPPAPGETICGSCGAGNAPARRFCRRCGASLADMPVARTLPWWRRLLHRNHVAPVAGTRPRVKPKRSHGKLWTALGVVAALVIAGYVTRPYWSPTAGEIIDRIKGTAEVNPSNFSASSAAAGHPARDVRDGATNTYWAPAGPAAGQWVQCDFAVPFRLVYLRVFNGAAEDLKVFLTEPSLQQVSITYYRKGAADVTRNYTLQDKPGQQQLHVALDDVVAVRVTIGSIYRPDSGPLAPLGELEFLARA